MPDREEAINNVAQAFRPQEEEGVGPAPTGGATPEVGEEDPLLSELTDRLMGQSDIVRSGTDRIEDAFEEARQEVRTAYDATQEKTESEFASLREEVESKARQETQTFKESRRGFATNTALLKDMRETHDKKINELSKQEQQAYAQGRADQAERLADLKLKEIEFEQEAEQQIFNNMLQEMTVGFELDQRERDVQRLDMERQKLLQDQSRINVEEKMFMTELASQHGVSVDDDDDFNTLTKKISEKDLTKREQLELDVMRAKIETEKTQNKVLLEELALEKRQIEEPKGSRFGFETEDRQRDFLSRAAAYRAEITQALRESPDEVDTDELYQDAVESLSIEFADMEGGQEKARQTAKRLLGLTPAGEEAVTVVDYTEDMPGTSTFEVGDYGEFLPDVVDPWSEDYENMAIGSRTPGVGGIAGTTDLPSGMELGETPEQLTKEEEDLSTYEETGGVLRSR